MSGTGVIPNTALASVNYNTKIRVYFQAYNGNLRESATNNGTDWTAGGSPLPAPVKPRTFTPIAATTYDKELNEIRVYYLTTDHHIHELCYSGDKGWYAGELNGHGFQAATYSQLAVIHWSDQFRVYYQRASDNKILELVRSGTNAWQSGATLREAIPGSRIAATRTPNDGLLRLYYQGTDFLTHQLTSKSNWGDVSVVPNALSPSHADFAAISWGTDVRLYLTGSGNPALLSEVQGNVSTESIWSGPSPLTNAIPLSYTSSVTWGNVAAIRVYFQEEPNTIVEWKWGEGTNWRRGATVPTK